MTVTLSFVFGCWITSTQSSKVEKGVPLELIIHGGRKCHGGAVTEDDQKRAVKYTEKSVEERLHHYITSRRVN